MDPKHSAGPMLMAPASHGAVESRSLPRLEPRPSPPSFPPIDQHIVPGDKADYEIIRGRRVSTMSAYVPHARAQTNLAMLISTHVKPGFFAPTELLTRVSEASDFATDVCVLQEGIDPATGTRYLEEIAFEVINEQRPGDAKMKAEDLTLRGVRRVFLVFVKKTYRIGEWSKELGQLVPLSEDDVIEDRLFVRPIPVRALLRALTEQAAGEDEMVRGLVAKGNAELAKLKEDAQAKGLDEGHRKGLDEGHRKGLDEGHRKGVQDTFRRMLRRRFGEVSEAIAQRIDSAPTEQLEQWTDRLFETQSLDELFG